MIMKNKLGVLNMTHKSYCLNMIKAVLSTLETFAAIAEKQDPIATEENIPYMEAIQECAAILTECIHKAEAKQLQPA